MGGVADTQDQTATLFVGATIPAGANGVIDLHPTGLNAGADDAQDASINTSGVDINVADALTDDEIIKPNPLYGQF